MSVSILILSQIFSIFYFNYQRRILGHPNSFLFIFFQTTSFTALETDSAAVSNPNLNLEQHRTWSFCFSCFPLPLIRRRLPTVAARRRPPFFAVGVDIFCLHLARDLNFCGSQFFSLPWARSSLRFGLVIFALLSLCYFLIL